MLNIFCVLLCHLNVIFKNLFLSFAHGLLVFSLLSWELCVYSRYQCWHILVRFAIIFSHFVAFHPLQILSQSRSFRFQPSPIYHAFMNHDFGIKSKNFLPGSDLEDFFLLRALQSYVCPQSILSSLLLRCETLVRFFLL